MSEHFNGREYDEKVVNDEAWEQQEILAKTEKPMPTQKSLELAAQAWCTPETSGIEMDSRLAIAFAEILDRRPAENPTGRGEIPALEAFDRLSALINERGPRSCGACGTPNATCSGDCVEASYIGADMLIVRRALSRVTGKGVEG